MDSGKVSQVTVFEFIYILGRIFPKICFSWKLHRPSHYFLSYTYDIYCKLLVSYCYLHVKLISCILKMLFSIQWYIWNVQNCTRNTFFDWKYREIQEEFSNWSILIITYSNVMQVIPIFGLRTYNWKRNTAP